MECSQGDRLKRYYTLGHLMSKKPTSEDASIVWAVFRVPCVCYIDESFENLL